MMPEIVMLVIYIGVGSAVLARWAPNDSECSYLNLEPAAMADRYAREFGAATMPRRMPFRLPAEYWLYEWTQRLVLARAAALGIGGLGLWLSMRYAEELGGPGAGVIAGAIVVSSPYVVGMLGTASYVSAVATLWIGGLYALSTGHPAIAVAIGCLLAVLRASTWGMSIALWVSGGAISLGPALVIVAYLSYAHWPVIRSNGWVRLLLREPCPVHGLPRDGWAYALRIAAHRFESWGAWIMLTLIVGRWSFDALWLLAITTGVFIATHLPRALIRPKWTLGYLSEMLFPVAVALAVSLTRAMAL